MLSHKQPLPSCALEPQNKNAMLRRAAAATARIGRRHASTPPQRADAVVVGAGLVGVCTASRLASAGLRVICVTWHPPCSYTSAVSTE